MRAWVWARVFARMPVCMSERTVRRQCFHIRKYVKCHCGVVWFQNNPARFSSLNSVGSYATHSNRMCAYACVWQLLIWAVSILCVHTIRCELRNSRTLGHSFYFSFELKFIIVTIYLESVISCIIKKIELGTNDVNTWKYPLKWTLSSWTLQPRLCSRIIWENSEYFWIHQLDNIL